VDGKGGSKKTGKNSVKKDEVGKKNWGMGGGKRRWGKRPFGPNVQGAGESVKEGNVRRSSPEKVPRGGKNEVAEVNRFKRGCKEIVGGKAGMERN